MVNFWPKRHLQQLLISQGVSYLLYFFQDCEVSFLGLLLICLIITAKCLAVHFVPNRFKLLKIIMPNFLIALEIIYAGFVVIHS